MYNTSETSSQTSKGNQSRNSRSKQQASPTSERRNSRSMERFEDLEDKEIVKNSNTQEENDDILNEEDRDILGETMDTPGKEPTIRKKPLGNSRYLQIANFWDVLCFGICLTSANITYGAWHDGLILGFWSFFYVTLIMSTVFICIHLCIAEMVSILPFSGGLYGFARVTLGPFFGYLTGCFESTANIIYAMFGMLQLGAYLTYMINGDRKYEPIYWLGFYVIIITNEFLGRKYYFRLIRVVAMLILLIFLFYIGESIPQQHPRKFIGVNEHRRPFLYGPELTVVSLQFVAFLYFGIEIIPLMSDEVKEPRKATPKAIVGTLIFVVVFSLLFMFLTYCQYPGYPTAIAVSAAPLNSGFTNTFHINDRIATAFAYFPLLATVSIYVYGFAKQMKALGNSKLLPPCLGWTFPNTNIPYVALIIGSLIGYSILLLSYFLDEIYANQAIPIRLYLTGFMFSYSSFILILISFIIFRIKYWTLPRGFINPLGIFSAIYAIFGLLLLLYILFRYVSVEFTFVKIFACYVGILTIFYFVYSKSHQVFSEEEQSILFKVYLMKTNERRRQGIFQRNQPNSCHVGVEPGAETRRNSFGKSRSLVLGKMFKSSSKGSSKRTVTPSTTTRRIHHNLVPSSELVAPRTIEEVASKLDEEATSVEEFRDV